MVFGSRLKTAGNRSAMVVAPATGGWWGLVVGEVVRGIASALASWAVPRSVPPPSDCRLADPCPPCVVEGKLSFAVVGVLVVSIAFSAVLIFVAGFAAGRWFVPSTPTVSRRPVRDERLLFNAAR